MKIDHLVLGAYQTNCYILRSDESSKDCLIIDTGLEADEPADFLRRGKLNPTAIILTHGHADHITGVAVLSENFPVIYRFWPVNHSAAANRLITLWKRGR